MVTKLTEQWKAEQRAFAERDLSGVDYVDLCGPTGSCVWRPSSLYRPSPTTITKARLQ